MTDDEKKRWLWRYRGSLEKEKALRANPEPSRRPQR